MKKEYNVPWANEEWFVEAKKRQLKIREEYTKNEIEEKCEDLRARIELLKSEHSDWSGALTEIYCEELNEARHRDKDKTK